MVSSMRDHENQISDVEKRSNAAFKLNFRDAGREQIGNLVKFREQQIQLLGVISGGFSTSKSRGVLALRAMFKISAQLTFDV